MKGENKCKNSSYYKLIFYYIRQCNCDYCLLEKFVFILYYVKEYCKLGKISECIFCTEPVI